MKTAKILLAIILLVLCCQKANASIINVPTDSSTIQKGINGANDGDTVLVEIGTYYENISFIGKAIVVASYFVYDLDYQTIEATIIDGSNPVQSDSASVVRFVSGENPASVIKGFTITGGTGTSHNGPGRALRQGGGVYCLDSSPTVANNVITDNHIPGQTGGARWEMGGGIGCWGSSSPIISNNLIVQNSCWDGGGGISLYYVYCGAGLAIVNNTISDNGGTGDGLRICEHDGFLDIRNNIIVDNPDAGIYFVYDPYPSSVTYNDVWNNSSGNFIGCPPGVGDTSWGFNFNGTPCDSFYNIIRNPLFDPDSTNYALLCSSENIDAGDEDFPPLVVGGAKIDQGAWEYPYILGDVNGDSIVNGGDINALINCIFGGQPSYCPCPWRAGDANCDGSVGAGDIVFLLSYLYRGGPPPDCEDCKTEMDSHKSSYERFGQVTFASPVRLNDGLVDLSLTGDIGAEVWGVDLEISYDPKVIQIVNPELGELTRNLQVYYGSQCGLMRIGLFDISGQNCISPGEGQLLTVKVKGTDLSSIKITEALLFDEYGNALVAGTEKKVEESVSLPDQFALHQNYPNPFNPETQISYDLPVAGHVKLAVYNIRGQRVKTLVNEHQAAGHKTVIWNSRDEAGDKVASGIYFYRFEAGNFTETKKMLLLQ